EELGSVLKRLEQEFLDVQDIEFTIEEGKLWILQTRAAKRTPRATLRIAIDLVHEGLITHEQARARLAGIDPESLVETSLKTVEPPAATG
ncbi:PEP/pyruvate-binding domain-containing protein, partial [Acinetobacter baumannii]